MAWRFWSTLGGAILAVVAFALASQAGLTPPQCWTAAVTTLCATWWICESLPFAATALVPFAVLPLVGVLDEKSVATAYGHPLVLLFMGGFMISRAAEHCGVHRRIAHGILRVVGATSGRRIVFGFMLATALCSMWMSNTATALMMLPVALAVLEQDGSGKLGAPLMLGVAYAATIGGLGTPIGTPPNGICLAAYETVSGEQISFPQWMVFGGTVMVLLFFATWLVLTFRLTGVEPIVMPPAEPWTPAQRRTLIVFGLTVLGWVTRAVPYGGWSQLFDIKTAGDTTVALLAAASLFLIPSGAGPGKRLLDWKTASDIPWGILLLFGGGIAIAEAFESSGLSDTIGQSLLHLHDWPTLAVMGVVSLVVTFMSELTSNTATANVLLPVLGATAKSAQVEPALLMIPAALAVSCGFMLPVATPPNAIAYGTGRIRMADMVRIGLVLDLISVTIVTLVCWKLLPLVFGIAAK